MRSSAMKYGGGVAAVIGFILLAMLGYIYAWDEARNWSAVDMSEYAGYAIAGLILLIGGLLAFIFIDE